MYDFIQRKEFPNTVLVIFKGVSIAKLVKGNNCWKLETFDIIHGFWLGNVINSFETLEIAKEKTIEYFNTKFYV